MCPASKPSLRPVGVRLSSTLVLVLLLSSALPVRPGWAEPLDELVPPGTHALQTSPAAQPPANAPVRLSVLDLLGKMAFAVLLAYGASFALARYRSRSSQPSSRRWRLASRETDHIRVRDFLALPRQEGTLYLVEMEGQTLLVGATGQQITVTWPPAAPEDTSAFTPQDPAAGRSTLEVLPEVASTGVSTPRPLPSTGRPARNQTEWAHERRRLINALMRAE